MRILRPLLCCAMALALPLPAFAAYSLDGQWLVSGRWSIGDPDSFSEELTPFHWDVSQSAGTLSIVRSGNTYPGTIDELTGAFHIDLPPSGGPIHSCNPTIDGVVDAASKSFTANGVGCACSLFTCLSTYEELVGSRCGNGELDVGETCDDGNADTGDCCSPTCGFESAGSACSSDDDNCTTDTCNASGTCQHVDNSAPCADATGCMTGNCSAGSCVLATPAVAGTSCNLDSDLCTDDACDGSGACAAGAPVDCAPCGHCEAAVGCVLDVDDCSHGNLGVDLTVGLGGSRSRLAINLQLSASAMALGNPTAGTNYTLCLGEGAPNSSQVVFEGEVAAGGTCDGLPCWKSVGDNFLYKNRTPANGIRSIRVSVAPNTESAYHYFVLRGKRDELALPSSFSEDFQYLVPKLVVDDGVTSTCWSHEVAPDKLSPRVFKGRYSPVQIDPE